MLTEVLEEKLTDALQMGYDATKDEKSEGSFVKSKEAFIVNIIQLRKLDSLLKSINYTLTKSGRHTDAVTRQMVACKWLVTPVVVHVKRHMNWIEEDHHFAHRLQCDFFDATYCSLRATAKMEP